MTIILPFSSDVTTYSDMALDWYKNESFSCPICTENTHRHGNYIRVCHGLADSFILTIYRRLCPHCNISFSFIPSFIKPYARFLNVYRVTLFEVFALEKASIKQTPNSSSISVTNRISPDTFRRWLKKISSNLTYINTLLLAQLLEEDSSLNIAKNLSPLAFLLHYADYFKKIIFSISSIGSLYALGIFDLLNLWLPKNLWL